MRRKHLAMLLICLGGFTAFAGCGKKSPSSEATTAVKEAKDATTETEATTEEETEATTEAEKTTDTEKEATTTEATQATEEVTTEKKSTTESTIADKEDEKQAAKSGTGTFNGWSDEDSVEIQMSNGKYQNFIVKDSSVSSVLDKIDEGSKISFTYGSLAGQANYQLLSVKKR